MLVYEAVAKAFVDEGCEAVFGLMGDGNMPFWGALARFPNVAIYSTRHEAAAVGMADGYFRATGKLPIATVTWGPGLTQAATPLTVACRNRTPMILALGQQGKNPKDRTQFVDHRRFGEICGARYQEVTSADTAEAQIAEAFYAARVHRIPVLLDIPIDVQFKTLDFDFDYKPSRNFIQPTDQVVATEESLLPIMEALMAAEKPIIIAGRGARWSGARDEIIALGEKSGALLATTLPNKGFFTGADYDIGVAGAFASAPTEKLFADCDFVLGIGAELGYFTTEGGLLFPSANVARIDIKPAPDEIGPLPGLFARGDARSAAATLTGMLEARQVRKAGYRSADTQTIMNTSPKQLDKPTDGVDPRGLMQKLGRALPPDVRIVTGVGHYLGFVVMYLPLPRQAEQIITYQFGSIGQALIQAVGVAAAKDGRPTVLIEGDGSLMVHVQELETAQREGLSLTVVVMNDNAFGAEVHKLRAKGFEPSLAKWSNPDFVALVRSFGGDGVVLTAEDDIGAALKAGIAKGGVFVIDARISPSTVSDTYRKLHFGLENLAPLLRPS
ncbi:thiamine pyrophosphate-binding protein [Pseudorhodoplanes sp.]|uniref:thiamine pyrophosphate-binding protein n=1 Tax=Pseudorhodoplanes sp. TaxID=1934341 RepID=UPI002C92A959|nr:thiamine pyrophosphate-binding protein [Pseudorhodoplanes sp.]HWV53667.1 thiamine pyrophosphate-binding protein [Pseudorhodoplanes sp.]